VNNQCPIDRDETAEAYVLGNLPEAEASSFKHHVATCSDCQAAVRRAEDFVRAIRDAAKKIRDREKPEG
jgi:anti-sigma factor RsiW